MDIQFKVFVVSHPGQVSSEVKHSTTFTVENNEDNLIVNRKLFGAVY